MLSPRLTRQFALAAGAAALVLSMAGAAMAQTPAQDQINTNHANADAMLRGD